MLFLSTFEYSKKNFKVLLTIFRLGYTYCNRSWYLEVDSTHFGQECKTVVSAKVRAPNPKYSLNTGQLIR